MLANDEAGVFNITDLWVAAATREDGLPYTSANLEEDVFDEEDESMAVGDETRENDRDPFSDETSILGVNPSVSRLRRDSLAATSVATGRQGGSPHRPSNRSGVLRNRANSSVSHVGRPAIYQNTGLSRSPVTSPAPRRESAGQPYLDQPYIQAPAAISPGLAAIPEGKLATDSGLLTVPGAADADITSMSRDPSPGLETKEKDPLQDFSILRDLPIALIAQYSLLALHGTIMDQVFMSFLVSKTAAGGLGLEASDFADIIACMCFFQMLFQFRFVSRHKQVIQSSPLTFTNVQVPYRFDATRTSDPCANVPTGSCPLPRTLYSIPRIATSAWSRRSSNWYGHLRTYFADSNSILGQYVGLASVIQPKRG